MAGKETSYFIYDASRSVAATGVTGALEVEAWDRYALQSAFTGLAATASGTITLQTSLNGTTFTDYPNSAQNFASGTTSLMWELTVKSHRYMRMQLSGTTTGTGTVTTTFYSERMTD